MSLPLLLYAGKYWNAEVAKTTSYSVLASDSGTLFTTTGAGGAVTFTLPAIASAAGLVFWFWATVDQNMIVTAPAGTMVTDGNSACASACYTTASHKIGSMCMVIGSDSAAKYYAFNIGTTAVTTA